MAFSSCFEQLFRSFARFVLTSLQAFAQPSVCRSQSRSAVRSLSRSAPALLRRPPALLSAEHRFTGSSIRSSRAFRSRRRRQQQPWRASADCRASTAAADSFGQPSQKERRCLHSAVRGSSPSFQPERRCRTPLSEAAHRASASLSYRHVSRHWGNQLRCLRGCAAALQGPSTRRWRWQLRGRCKAGAESLPRLPLRLFEHWRLRIGGPTLL